MSELAGYWEKKLERPTLLPFGCRILTDRLLPSLRAYDRLERVERLEIDGKKKSDGGRRELGVLLRCAGAAGHRAYQLRKGKWKIERASINSTKSNTAAVRWGARTGRNGGNGRGWGEHT